MIYGVVLAVDICNTIADINSLIVERFGPNPDPSSYFHPALKEKPNYFEDNLGLFLEAKPIKGSVVALSHLAKHNTLVYLTARPKIADFVTRLWLKQHGYPPGDVIFTDNKAEVARRLGVVLAFDDAPFEIERYVNSGIEVLVKKQDYNIGYPNRFDWE